MGYHWWYKKWGHGDCWEAMKKFDTKWQVPCIGVMPLGGLTQKWRDLLYSESILGPNGKTNLLDPSKAEGDEKDGAIPLAHLDDCHTHIRVIDNHEKGAKAFSLELPFRAEFEACVGRNATSLAGLLSDGMPRVMIMVNGGKFSLKAIEESIEEGCPCIVCHGSGRFADVISAET